MAYQPKSYRKFIAGAAAAAVVAPAVAPVAFAAELSDIKDYEFKAEIDSLIAKGIISGYPDGTFRPYAEITRGEAAIMIARAKGLLTGKDIPANNFSDVSENQASYEAVLKLAEAGIVSGFPDGSFKPLEKITRAQMAKYIVNAYDLTEGDGKTAFPDVAENAALATFVDAIVEAGIASGYTDGNFGYNDPLKRGHFAKMVFNAEKDVETPGDGITKVNAINDTTVEVTFGTAIDSDFIREAEQNGKYFAIYKKGETIRGQIIQSESLSFSADGKKAQFILESGKAIQSGEEYYVVLLDGPDASVAEIVESFGPTVLRPAASQPGIEVSSVTDKIYLDFKEEMKASALDVDNYQVYDDGGKLIGDLADFVVETTQGQWVNAITKDQVEFTLDPATNKKKLSAGKTYKIKLTTNLETKANKTLDKDSLVITIQTPSVKEAAPKVTMARVTADDEIVLVFDKDVTEVNLKGLNNLVEITTATNKKVNTTKVEGKIGAIPNEVVLTLTPADAEADKLDRATTYKVDIPANLVTNAVFPNAANEAVTGIKATAQDNKAISSVSAELVTDDKNRGQANLVLEFDQRPTLASVRKALTEKNIDIIDGTDVYEFAGDKLKVKYLGTDNTGKTVVIEDVNHDFKLGDNAFTPETGTSYTVEIAAGAIEVDAFNGSGATNQSKLKAVISNGVNVTGPEVDRVSLKSATEMVIEFKDEIYSEVDLNKISVAGFESDLNKFYSAKALTGDRNLEVSVSGNKLTLKAKDGVVFVTGTEKVTGNAAEGLVKFGKDAVVAKGSKLSIQETTVNFGKIEAGKVDGVKVVDDAAPVLAFAQESDDVDNLVFVFTENIDVEGEVATQFRTGGAAAKSSIGKESAVGGNTLEVTFTDAWKDDSTDLLDVTVEYNQGQTIYIADAKGNKVVDTDLKGVKAGAFGFTPDPEKPTPGAKTVASYNGQVVLDPILQTYVVRIPAANVEGATAEDTLKLTLGQKTYELTYDAERDIFTNGVIEADSVDAVKGAEIEVVKAPAPVAKTVADLGGQVVLDPILQTYVVRIPAANVEGATAESTVELTLGGTKYVLTYDAERDIFSNGVIEADSVDAVNDATVTVK